MPAPSLSVVVPSHNRIASLRLVLAGLSRQTLERADYEVIVVDDGSDEPAEQVSADFPVRVVRLPIRRGQAYARNRGAEIARGRWLAFLDDDMIPHPDLLRAHQRTSRAGTVTLGYTFQLLHADVERAIAQQDMKPDARERQYDYYSCNLSSWIAPWQVCYSANLSLARDLFEQVGGFDEEYTTWGIEDVEFGYRLHRAGAQYHLSRDAISYHLPRERNVRAQMESMQQNMQLFLKKHRTFDIELFTVRVNGFQDVVRDVLHIVAKRTPTWQVAAAGLEVPHPCAVMCGGSGVPSGDRWRVYHPSLQPSRDPVSLLGITTQEPDQSFASTLLTSVTLELPRPLFPYMIDEAFRLAPVVLLEVPDDLDREAAVLLTELNLAGQPLAPGRSLWQLRDLSRA